MRGLSNLIEIPNRVNLATQVADVIRKTIGQGIWGKEIPSERRLSELLKVSRPTIRVALHMLAKDGLLEISPRTRKRLLGGRSHTATPPKKTVGIITHEQITRLGLSYYVHITEFIVRLSEEGFAVEIFVCKPIRGFSQSEKLDKFLRENRILCCLLLSVNKVVQCWFAERSFPALVLGSCHDSVRLPSIDIDLRAVCRHAAGVFLTHGHRRLALIVPDSGLAGDLASEAGFKEGAQLHADTGKEVRSVIIRHDGTFQNITAKLERIFDAAEAPTALLVAKPWPTFAVLIYLLKRGLAVPDSVSLIARDQDFFFETIDPKISHYRFKDNAYTQRAAHLIMKIVHQGNLPPVPNLVYPDFFEGGTVVRNRSG